MKDLRPIISHMNTKIQTVYKTSKENKQRKNVQTQYQTMDTKMMGKIL